MAQLYGRVWIGGELTRYVADMAQPGGVMTGVGYVHPAYNSGHGADWLQTLPSGPFMTGTLDTFGRPVSEDGASVQPRARHPPGAGAWGASRVHP